MNRVGIGIIGLGMAVKPHALALRDLAQKVEVIGAYSPSPERRAAFAQQYDLPVVASLDALLADARVRAALILTPPRTHSELAMRAAGAGKDVLLEKPVDVDLPAARALVEHFEARGRTLGTVFQHRFRPGALQLARLLRERALGGLLSTSTSIRWWRAADYFAQPGRGTLARDGGGVLLTQAIHTLDLLLDLVGPAQRVSAVCRTSPLRAIDTEDIACATVEYADGGIGVIDATSAAYPGYPERIEVAGELGSALLEAEALTVRQQGKPPLEVAGSSEGGGGADPMAFSHGAHRLLIEDFVDAMVQGRAPRASGRSALRVHALIDAMLESSREGRPVEVAPTD
ncbi:MAG TPA: Gfo/Idh/MocA family oxidoreductase [Casimicrobiaceae bacterium]|nr:Gfo/Idh/MocA family oxidoreductase [Casimicrobiaceae bacterium]